jgi:tetratricopeptide (TPR) repeat protein
VPSLRDQLVSALAGRYDVVRELGHGGMAYVFLAHDLKHDRQVAIKVLKPELATTIGVGRFLREIRITARLEHPNILRLYASDNVGTSLLYYIVQYVPGDTLRHKLDRETQLPLDEALAITKQVAAALDYAHAHGVIHRDIKPANILLHDGQAIVADFGLARMYDATDTTPITQSAVVIGTPAYMSPEQVSGDAELDGRTDVYSLACVFFEMVAGTPPFHASTRQALYGLHLSATPPSLCAERENCPPEMDSAVQRALSKVPADRFRTAGEFARALEGETVSGPNVRRVSPAGGVRPRARSWPRLAGVSAVAAAAVLGAVFVLRGPDPPAATLDTSSYVVLPFTARSPGADTAAITARVIEALNEWDGVQVRDERATADAVADKRRNAFRLTDATAVARSLRAGRLVWGEAAKDHDSVIVRASVYDPTSGNAIRSASASFSAAKGPSTQSFRALANSLLRKRDESPWSGSTARPRQSLPAWLAYDDGRLAAGQWDISAAERHFRDAVAIDPDLAQAQLWLARTLIWRGAPKDAWRPFAARASELRDQLVPDDALAADAQMAMAEARYPEACAAYARVVAHDSTSVGGWFGLGECQSRDNTVVRDPRSASGYRFRGSIESAVRAYRRILENRSPPPAFVYRRLADLLYVEGNRYRPGKEAGTDKPFGAYPSLGHDTLAFVPYPLPVLLAGDPRMNVRSKADAIDHNRALLRSVYSDWVTMAPNDPEPRIVLTTLLELAEEISGGGPDTLTALNQNDVALRLAADTLQRLQVARTRARLLVKTSDWDHASRFADSIFAANPNPTRDTLGVLAGMAALSGRIRTLADILRAHATSSMNQFVNSEATPLALKPTMQQEVLSAYAFAALGVCTDSLRAFSRRVDVALQSHVLDARRRATHDAIVGNTLAFAVPCLGPGSVSGIDDGGDNVIAMEQSLARGDRAAVRARMAKVQAGRSGDRPGEVAIEYTYIESWLLAQIGDTAEAIAHLDRSLNALPTLGRYLLDRPSQSAGLVRAMGLRAELAAATRDGLTARKWSRAVATLWSHADPELQPYVSKMRELAAPGH